MPRAFHNFAATLTHDAISEAARAVLRRSFLDMMGVAAVASTTQMAAIARGAATALCDARTAGAARILMHGAAISPADAAMAGAFTVDSVDTHDGSSPCKGHAGAAVFPALLALADVKKGMQSSNFVTLLAIGYEVSYRAGLAHNSTCADYHTSGAWTAVGIATAVARGLGCSPAQIRHAAGIGEYHGPRSQLRSYRRTCHGLRSST